MSSRLADEREQRRGLILGLTLAEVLLLLLFLLLLALASQLRSLRSQAEEAQRGLEELRPLQQAMMSAGAIDITSVQKLADRVRQVDRLENEVSALKQQAETFSHQSELLKSTGLES